MSAPESKSELTVTQRVELANLIKQRGIIKGRVTKFSEYVQTTKELKEISLVRYKELELKLGRCQLLLSDYETIQDKIDLLHPEPTEQINERDSIENQFLTLISNCQELLDGKPRSVGDNNLVNEFNSCQSYSNNAIKLPTIKLPTFDGTYLHWLEFKDTFESVINSNESIPPINKFHYLRSSLEGSAAVVIKSIEFSARNYKVAWDLLLERFDNKNILINNHLKALFSIDSLRSESFKSLRFIVDHVSKHLRALDSLGQPTDKWDALIIFMVSAKLDINTSRKWEEIKCSLNDSPSLSEFYSFLRSRADVLETAYSYSLSNTNRFEKSADYKHKPNNQAKSFVVSRVDKVVSCVLCNKEHPLHKCQIFKDMSIGDRFNEVNRLKLCQNCLRSGHNSYQCHLKAMCLTCKKKHNTLIHRITPSHAVEQQPSVTSSLPVSQTTSLSSSSSSPSDGQVLLCTAVVQITVNNKTYNARALLDTGSQSSFVTEKLKLKLGLPVDRSNSVNVCGINNVGCNISQRCILKVKSRVAPFELNVKCLVVPCITGMLPNSVVDTEYLNLPSNIELADPEYFSPAEVDILLGADVYWEIIGSNLIKLGSNMPVLQESKLGWIVSGPLPITISQSTPNVHCNFSQEIKDSLEKFWNVDDLPLTKRTYSTEEQLCENHFVKNVSRLNNGRFSVKIPLKEEPEEALCDSYFIAKKCLESLERKLNKYPKLKADYTAFINEYANLGHLTKINRPAFGYYLPHHAVIREKSETTKLRVVFNASSKTRSGKSLNDIQMVGPVLQSDLVSILIRFREHKFVLTGDIEKMYRQLELHPSQRHLQLILWRDGKDDVDVLQLNTVSYGTASASFLSSRCLLQLANECKDELIARIIKSDFYADDLNTGSDSVDGLKYIHKNVVEVLNSACLPLRKFRTNCPELFNDDTESSKSIDFSKESSVLGLNWSPKVDILQFSTDLAPSPQITKRSVISATAKVFDPLGLLAPCIIVAKILLQELWSSKLDWDEPVPAEFSKNWSSLLKEFQDLFLIQIPRRALCETPRNIELHCFVDASQQAYAACVYLRSENQEGQNITVRLLCAKSRVAPLNPTTIPRLELSGALLGARLCSKVLQSLQCDISKKYLWTDSTVVLGWLKTVPRDLKIFVCNRVNEIHELTTGFTFCHVPTDQNPADMASRGVSPKRLHSSSLWWEGPSFLADDPSNWPNTHAHIPANLPEVKTKTRCHVTTATNAIEFDRYSNLNKLKRIYGYVLRFVTNCKNKNTKVTEPLDADELDKSLLLLVNHSQLESYGDEIKIITNNKPLGKKSKLLSLNCFVDANGLLRTGGRIQNSNFDYDKKHPLILDSKHHFTKLLFKHEHERLFHAGPQHLLASMRERFWPIGGRNLARGTSKQCMICVRLRGLTIQPLMGNVPYERIPGNESNNNFGFSFQHCGVDFAGPFLISSRKGRGNRITKCYLCLFICLSTKAVHLELVSDLSTEAFILSLRRFVSRRGKPHSIFCDNGTNFKGASNEIGRLLRSGRGSVANYACNEGFKFVFSPAYSPHFGGIWEAGVKSAKFHLRRVAGNASLTFEELATLFAQIEAILNSRPLTPLSSDPNDLTPLTPGHLLIGRPLTGVPSLPMNMKNPNRYQLVEKLRQHFWQRWRREFVAELQQRTKWKTRQRELRVGDLVLLKEDNLPPLQWRLARIRQLYPGVDGISRVADVLTSKGIIRRAINKMCVIPATNDEEQIL